MLRCNSYLSEKKRMFRVFWAFGSVLVLGHRQRHGRTKESCNSIPLYLEHLRARSRRSRLIGGLAARAVLCAQGLAWTCDCVHKARTRKAAQALDPPVRPHLRSFHGDSFVLAYKGGHEKARASIFSQYPPGIYFLRHQASR